jgi:hypothetical protein
MKRIGTRFLLIALSLIFAVGGMTACGGDDAPERLDPVETHYIQEETVASTVVTDGFTIQIRKTYAEIVGYKGDATELELPATAAGMTVKVIGEAAFADNKKITKVTLPKGTLVVDRYAFENCEALTEVVFNDSLESVRDFAFRNSGLTVLDLPDSLVGVGKYSFYGTKIDSLTIPESVSRLGKFAFYGCTNLKTVTFCARLHTIGENAFQNCTALTELVIPKTVEKLEPYAFAGCTALNTIVISKYTTSIGEGIFTGCSALTVYAPKGSAAEKTASLNNYSFEACDYNKKAAEVAS